MQRPFSLRLEKYTIKRQDEVLVVKIETPYGESDTILIYNGFSGSLERSTTYDPDIPVIKEDDKIITIERLASPYDPIKPKYLQVGMTRQDMEKILTEMGI
jgi:hypothetical protein